MMELRTCRKCRQTDWTEKLLYLGKRYYIHPKCGLEKWGADLFDRLPDWQLKRFPPLLAIDAGLEKELRAAIERSA